MEPPFQDMLIPKNLLDLVQPDPTFEAGKHACSKLQGKHNLHTLSLIG